MAKILFVISVIVLSIGLINTYATDCATGPEYWCQSFEQAQNCGALRHCIDTIWNNDNQIITSDSSINCQWCERILENIHHGLADNEAIYTSTLISGCRLLSTEDHISKCTNAIENYATSVESLMKNKRFTTLCRLMNVCIKETSPKTVGSHRCTWGPSYWCSSLSNSRECQSIEHCSNQIWSQQSIKKKENDNICQYCQYLMEKLRSMINNDQTPDNVKQWLNGACKMLENNQAINACVETMSQYGNEILVLIRNEIDLGIICHLGQMCNDATIIPREQISEDQSQMLCNVIVRATHELHVNQGKNEDEIENFLKNDCQQLSTINLQQKCGDLIERYGRDIYRNVVNKMELSKICDNTAFLPVAHSQCDICVFALANTKTMLNGQSSKDDILSYIDQHICENFEDDMKKNCKSMIEIHDEELIEQIKQGTQPLLICTYFQTCFTEVVDKTSPIKKDEMGAFLLDSLCGNLGIFENTCNALLIKDSMGVIKSLVTDVDGDVVCQLFGICPQKISEIGGLTLNDDTNKCVRCITDITRRRYIALQLMNYASKFLEHLCGRSLKYDECMKAAEPSINRLQQFFQSFNPNEICVEFNSCDATSIPNIELSLFDHAISEEVRKYIKKEICAGIGPLSSWCNHLIDSEGENLFEQISKRIDPHDINLVIDICPGTTAFDNCNDKCECCISKVENYQIQLAGFLHTILATSEGLCESTPNSNECQKLTIKLKSTIDEIMNSFNVKGICQLFNHCPTSTSAPCNVDIANRCSCCQENINQRQTNLRKITDEIISSLLNFCTNDDCRSKIEKKKDNVTNQLANFNPLTLCQRFGFCSNVNSERSIPFLSDLMLTTYSNLDSAMDEISENLCSDLGDLKLLCQHLTTFKENTRYYQVYMVFLKNQVSIIDEDFHAQTTSTCDACKNTVQTSKDFWINGLTSIRDLLLQTCDYCTVKDQCRDYYNRRYNDLKTYIDQIDSQQFCQNIHLCSITSNDICETCVKNLDERKDAFIQAIDRLAGYFSDLCQTYADKTCQAYVQELKKSIQEFITKFNSREVCTTMGFCGTNVEENNIDFDQYQRSVEDEIEKTICSTLGPFETLCKAVIHGNIDDIQNLEMNYDIKDVMQIGEILTESNCSDRCKCCIARVQQRKRLIKFTGDAIFMSLKQSCDKCPAKQQCRLFYRMAQARFDKRIDQICPYMVCKHLGYCNKTEESINTDVQIIENSNSTCILCEYVMDALSDYIHEQSTEEELEEGLKKICDQFPSVLQNQCREYIENYSPTIISLLFNQFNLSTICQRLNLCTQQMKVNIGYLIKADRTTCGICDYISTYVQYALQRDSQEKSLERALSIVCTQLSDDHSPACQIIVQLFAPYIQQLQLGPDNNFCKQLSICQIPAIELTSAQSIDEKTKATPKCTICLYVMSYLDASLKNNKSEQAIEEALKKVCTILPEKQRSECQELVKTYGSVIAELIAQSADPATICHYLGLCDGSFTMTEQTPYTCNICQYVLSRMKLFFGLSENEDDITKSLQGSCDLFTVDNLKQQCKDFLNRYQSHFSPIISDELEPKIACQGIDVCTNHLQTSTAAAVTDIPTEPVTHFGKCIFGMNYWCQNRETAQQCNAIELCELHVWSKKKIITT